VKRTLKRCGCQLGSCPSFAACTSVVLSNPKSTHHTPLRPAGRLPLPNRERWPCAWSPPALRISPLAPLAVVPQLPLELCSSRAPSPQAHTPSRSDSHPASSSSERSNRAKAATQRKGGGFSRSLHKGCGLPVGTAPVVSVRAHAGGGGGGGGVGRTALHSAATELRAGSRAADGAGRAIRPSRTRVARYDAGRVPAGWRRES